MNGDPRDRWDETAVSLAAQVHAGRRTAVSAVESALAQIAAGDDQLHAVETVCDEAALNAAQQVDAIIHAGGDPGPLAGVPVVVKAELDLAGVVTTFGGRAHSLPSLEDSEVVRRLRAAGAVPVATTRMPEFGQFPFTEGDWGETRNPWDLRRSPGGSSGGSAVAVAAGWVPLGLGSDGGGSLRIPASCTGLVGLKPVRGRVSTAPYSNLWGPLGTLGPLSRTVQDTAVTYDVLRGATRVDRYAAPAPSMTFTEAAGRDPGRLRIAVIARSPWPGVTVDPRVRAVVLDVAGRCSQAGHDVSELTCRWPDAQSALVPLFYAAIREESRRVENVRRCERRTKAMLRSGAWVRPLVRLAAIREAARIARGVRERFGAYDVLLSPTMAVVPPLVGRVAGAGAARTLRRSMPLVAFTSLANVTGHAAMSVPGGIVDGLPVGVQLYSPGGDETALLPLAAQLERSQPGRRPPWPS
ncbi:amidase family protein [Austwickia sp. TVS 96-490-7B]|uniref:amidase family protein n=1 Tax=Austwickia sp. TVS 96-490-7B TaxID=2830843 RepID=UPI001C561303|nr:amidase family protein [Austwickia sp. TVS 96-490-7B]